MLTFLKTRRNGRSLARRVRRSLLDTEKFWQVGALPANVYGAQLERKKVRVVLMPCDCACKFLRIFDRCRLLVDGVDVFVPLVARIRLRTAARYVVQRDAETKL